MASSEPLLLDVQERGLAQPEKPKPEKQSAKDVLEDYCEEGPGRLLLNFKMPIFVSLCVFASFSLLYWEIRKHRGGGNATGQAVAWLLFLMDLGLAAVMAATTKVVLVFWQSVPKVKQRIRGLKDFVLKMLEKTKSYKDSVIFSLNALQARTLAKAFQIESEAKVRLFQTARDAEREVNADVRKAEEAIKSFMGSMEEKINAELNKVQEDAHKAETLAVSKARDAEDEVVKHVNDVVGEVESKVDEVLNKALVGLNKFLDKIKEDLDKIVSNIPWICQSHKIVEEKDKMKEDLDGLHGLESAEGLEGQAFKQVSMAIDSARQKADAAIDEANTQANTEIDTTMNRVKWGAKQEEGEMDRKVKQDADTLNSMVALAGKKVDDTLQHEADLADAKLRELDELVRKRTAQLEEAVNENWARLEKTCKTQMDKTEHDLIVSIDDIRELVRRGAMPIIALQFTIVFWTGMNAYYAFVQP